MKSIITYVSQAFQVEKVCASVSIWHLYETCDYIPSLFTLTNYYFVYMLGPCVCLGW